MKISKLSRKTRNMLYKGLLLLIAVIFILVPIRTVSDVQARVYVSCIGIDGTADEVTVTVEVVGKENLALVGKGSSINLAFENISNKAGKYLELSHCGLIVLGKEVNTTMFQRAFRLLLNDGRINAGCTILSSEKMAAEDYVKKLLTLSPDGGGAGDYMSYLDSNVNAAAYGIIGVMSQLNSKSGSVFVPIIEVVDGDGKAGGSTNSPEGSQSASTSPSESGEEKKVEMKITHTCRTFGNKEIKVNEMATEGLNWLFNSTNGGYVSIQNFSYNGKDLGSIAAKIKSQSGSVELKSADSAELSVNARIHFENRDKIIELMLSGGDFDIDDITKQLVAAFEDSVTKQLKAIADFCKTEGIDLLGIRNEVYKYYPDKLQGIEDTLKTVQISAQTKLEAV